MSVRELLRSKHGNVITIPIGASVATAAHLLIRHGIGALPVVSRAGTVEGLLSERDIVRAVDRQGEDVRALEGVHDIPVERVMRRPAPLCSPDDSLYELMSRMTRERLRHLVVIEGGSAVAVISVGDIVKHRLEQLDVEAGVLRDYVAAQRANM